MTAAPPVLLVDDDEDIREAIGDVLRSRAVPVETAASGQQALALLAAGRAPSVILLDLRMPRMSGEAVIAELQRDPRWRHIPVVVLSGDAEAARIAAQLGAQAYLRKPIELAALMQMVERFRPAELPVQPSP